MKKKLIAAAVVIIAALVLIKPYIYSDKVYSAEDFGIAELYSDNNADGDDLDDYHDIMLGARAYAETKPKYKSEYYEGGYPDDGVGVCTDVVWRAFAAAGYDLKSLVDDDISENPSAYTTIETPDPNIDFRRVKNLKIFFDRNAEVLSDELDDPADWQPGDIVVFKNHIVICSDKRNSDGIPFIIHHDGRGAREANDIENYEILGHYRWS